MKSIVNPYAKGPVDKKKTIARRAAGNFLPLSETKKPIMTTTVMADATTTHPTSNNSSRPTSNAVKTGIATVTPSSMISKPPKDPSPKMPSVVKQALAHQRPSSTAATTGAAAVATTSKKTASLTSTPAPIATTTTTTTAAVRPAPALTLRAKLKQDIEHLKRQKLLQKQRQEEEKRRKKAAEKQRCKVEKKKRITAEQQQQQLKQNNKLLRQGQQQPPPPKKKQKQNEIAAAMTAKQLDNSTNNASTAADTTLANKDSDTAILQSLNNDGTPLFMLSSSLSNTTTTTTTSSSSSQPSVRHAVPPTKASVPPVAAVVAAAPAAASDTPLSRLAKTMQNKSISPSSQQQQQPPPLETIQGKMTTTPTMAAAAAATEHAFIHPTQQNIIMPRVDAAATAAHPNQTPSCYRSGNPTTRMLTPPSSLIGNTSASSSYHPIMSVNGGGGYFHSYELQQQQQQPFHHGLEKNQAFWPNHQAHHQNRQQLSMTSSPPPPAAVVVNSQPLTTSLFAAANPFQQPVWWSAAGAVAAAANGMMAMIKNPFFTQPPPLLPSTAATATQTMVPSQQQQQQHPSSAMAHRHHRHLPTAKSTKSLPQKEAVLTPTPCRLPSPFALTHEIVPHKIVLIKKTGQQGFGMTVQKTIQTALVAPDEWPRHQEKLQQQQQQQQQKQECDEKEVSLESNLPSGASKSMVQEENAPSFVDNNVNSNNQEPAIPKNHPVIPNTRIRRKRMAFAVLEVLDPSEQNKREHPGKNSNCLMTVEPGDIILSIHGTQTANLTFQQACALFGQCQQVHQDDDGDGDGYVHCEITVARRKKTSIFATPRPFPAVLTAANNNSSSNNNKMLIRNDPLDATEQAALIQTVLQLMMDPQRRMLGKLISSNQLEASFKTIPALQLRSSTFLQSAWNDLALAMQTQMMQRAVTNWKNEWEQETKEIREQAKSYAFLTDAQRSDLRALPRPAKGCRCGSQEHDYVDDPMCPLYSNVRRWVALTKGENEDKNELERKKKKLKKSQLPKDLNVVEKAYTDRFVRMRQEESALAAEVTFVERMEDYLLHERGQAIYAPGLTAMVLSAVVELESEFKERKPLTVKTNLVEIQTVTTSENHNSDEDSDDDDDDDDVPLAELGKRSGSSDDGPANKKAKTEAITVSLEYLACLLRFVSKRWGHVYSEPSNVDYAWRWEVYYAQLVINSTNEEGSTKWEANRKNPRREGTRSLENLHFIVDENVVTQLQQQQVGQEASEQAQKTLAFAISPEMNGVYDELQALVSCGVVRVNEAGIPVMSMDWYNNVDLLLLDDMDTSWGTRADPSGKHLVSERLRKTLAKTWTKTFHGWAFSDAPRETIFDFDEFDSWRDAFEEKVQSKEDVSEGVGEFGI